MRASPAPALLAASSRHRHTHVTLTATLARLLVLRSFKWIFEEKTDLSMSKGGLYKNILKSIKTKMIPKKIDPYGRDVLEY